jgi:hypothetical protein
MNFFYTPLRNAIVLTLSMLISFVTSAQHHYVWIDASGIKVFSDQAPPSDIPTKRILQQPGKLSSLNNEENKTNSTLKKDTDLLSENSKKDKDLETKKKKNDEELAAIKKIEFEANQKNKVDNCVRAKQAKITLDSGMRLSHTNSKGERGFMDEATRLVEVKRLESIISSDCK